MSSPWPPVHRSKIGKRLYTVVDMSRVWRLCSTLSASLAIIATALICYRVHVDATIAAVALLLGVLLAGAYRKPAEAIIASFAATLCLDYLFVPPVGSMVIRDPQGWVALIVFLSAALVATNLASGLRRQRDQLIAQRREAEKLYALSRAMLFSDGEDVRRLVINKCIELFGFSEAALFESSTGQFHRSAGEAPIPDEALRRVALYGSIDRSAGNTVTIVPVTLGNKNLGSVGFRGTALPQATLEALGNTVAIGLAQAQAQEAGSRAEAVRKSEELKSVMIDALAHDLKTPLTAIEAAADTLQHCSAVPSPLRFELLEVIQQEAQGLRRMMNEAIHLARIDAKRLKLERQPTSVRELIDLAIQSLGERSTTHRVEIALAKDLPLVFADRELIVQALKQLLDNAIKYSPSRSSVVISAEANGLISISVHDQGQGLTELEQGRVFDKFYRGRYDRSAVQGTGMGLAITKEIAEAHGGSAAVESQIGQGSRFTITLPAAPEAVEVGHFPA